ncbi:hypothetical protein P167DRAFT_580525 [Morchella conica CCBAS932]|uniref:Uncharacterized protein n=1 Tax=Morchella conica CCBAS932 TaxID=1392247 RepID=A0A3N4KAQ2_9PEZI|nr:hypothetical protein P167DRAFT_580525 [Morchella conica CCBAS932]
MGEAYFVILESTKDVPYGYRNKSIASEGYRDRRENCKGPEDHECDGEGSEYSENSDDNGDSHLVQQT